MPSADKNSNNTVIDSLEEKPIDIVADPSSVTFPEGGIQAWCSVAGAWMVQFCTLGYVNAFGVYQDFYTREYLRNSSASAISWIGSLQVMLQLSLGLFTGRIFDNGHFRFLSLSGSLLFVFCLFMLSLSSSGHYYQVFLSQGLGLGISLGLTYVPSLGVVAHHFQRRRSFAMGIVASGSSFGGVIHPIMLNKLFNGRVGFHNGVRASAGLNAGLLILANLLMTPRLPPRSRHGQIRSWIGFLKEPEYCAAVAGNFFVILGLFFPIFYLQLDSILHGVNPTLSFYSIAIMNASSFVGRLIPSFFTISLGVYNMIIPASFGCAILIFAMIAVNNAASVIIIAIFYGFFSGACVTLLAPMLSELAVNFNEVGARMGISFTFAGFGSLIGPPVMGALLSSRYTWFHPALFSGISISLGGVSLIVSRYLVVRKRGRSRC